MYYFPIRPSYFSYLFEHHTLHQLLLHHFHFPYRNTSQRRCHYPLVWLLTFPFFLKLTLSPFGPLHSSQTVCQGIYIAKPNTFVLGPAMGCRVSLLLTHLRALDEAFESLGCLGGAGLSIASFWWQTCDRWVITYYTSKGQIPGVCWRLEWEIVLLTSDVTRQPAIWDHLYSMPGPVLLNSRQSIPVRFFSIFFFLLPSFLHPLVLASTS